MDAELLNRENKKVGTVSVPDAVFARKWNADLVHQVVTAERANARNPIAHTKDRSEVRGGGKKPWAQKHAGKARHGSTRSPLWAGGGVTFGPRKDRDFTQKINKKMRRAALYSLLSRKLKDGEVKFLEDLKLPERKTKQVALMLKGFFKTPQSVLIVPAKGNIDIFHAGRNIPRIAITAAPSLGVYECSTHRYLMIEKAAILELTPSK